MRKLT